MASEFHTNAFLTGVIEGFYGRSWSFETRLAYADFLHLAGLNTYIYCPKNDPYLRRKWQENWPDTDWKKLLQLSKTYRDKGMFWGVGLSPVELYRNYGAVQKRQLKHKLEKLSELAAPIIAILFDDMPGDMVSLAVRQAEIVADVCLWLPSTRVLVCPTYYSFDPILEKFFGTRPPGYWEQIGIQMPINVEILWTGNMVCSRSIEPDDIQEIVTAVGRPVTIWDNYPVNDGAERSNFLYTSKLTARSAALRPLINGHLCNPMNQALLSLPALSGLAELYSGSRLESSVLSKILGAQTWEKLTRDQYEFEQLGLRGMGNERRNLLAMEYAQLSGPAAAEITDWLRGLYEFDPACLT